MAPNRKAAFPSKAGRPEKTASNTTARKNTIPPSTRQHIKQRIVCAACWGLIPTPLAEWLIVRLGVRHD